MPRPPRIKDGVSVFIGVIGVIGIVINLWISVFTTKRHPFNLFAYLLLTVFSTVFFVWLIDSNIRKNSEYDKPKDNVYDNRNK